MSSTANCNDSPPDSSADSNCLKVDSFCAQSESVATSEAPQVSGLLQFALDHHDPFFRYGQQNSSARRFPPQRAYRRGIHFKLCTQRAKKAATASSIVTQAAPRLPKPHPYRLRVVSRLLFSRPVLNACLSSGTILVLLYLILWITPIVALATGWVPLSNWTIGSWSIINLLAVLLLVSRLNRFLLSQVTQTFEFWVFFVSVVLFVSFSVWQAAVHYPFDSHHRVSLQAYTIWHGMIFFVMGFDLTWVIVQDALLLPRVFAIAQTLVCVLGCLALWITGRLLNRDPLLVNQPVDTLPQLCSPSGLCYTLQRARLDIMALPSLMAARSLFVLLVHPGRLALIKSTLALRLADRRTAYEQPQQQQPQQQQPQPGQRCLSSAATTSCHRFACLGSRNFAVATFSRPNSDSAAVTAGWAIRPRPRRRQLHTCVRLPPPPPPQLGLSSPTSLASHRSDEPRKVRILEVDDDSSSSSVSRLNSSSSVVIADTSTCLSSPQFALSNSSIEITILPEHSVLTSIDLTSSHSVLNETQSRVSQHSGSDSSLHPNALFDTSLTASFSPRGDSLTLSSSFKCVNTIASPSTSFNSSTPGGCRGDARSPSSFAQSASTGCSSPASDQSLLSPSSRYFSVSGVSPSISLPSSSPSVASPFVHSSSSMSSRSPHIVSRDTGRFFTTASSSLSSFSSSSSLPSTTSSILRVSPATWRRPLKSMKSATESTGCSPHTLSIQSAISSSISSLRPVASSRSNSLRVSGRSVRTAFDWNDQVAELSEPSFGASIASRMTDHPPLSPLPSLPPAAVRFWTSDALSWSADRQRAIRNVPSSVRSGLNSDSEKQHSNLSDADDSPSLGSISSTSPALSYSRSNQPNAAQFNVDDQGLSLNISIPTLQEADFSETTIPAPFEPTPPPPPSTALNDPSDVMNFTTDANPCISNEARLQSSPRSADCVDHLPNEGPKQSSMEGSAEVDSGNAISSGIATNTEIETNLPFRHCRTSRMIRSVSSHQAAASMPPASVAWIDQLKMTSAPIFELWLISAWRQDYSSEEFEPKPLIPALLPEWFAKPHSFLGPILVLFLFLMNQPKSWFMMAFVVLIELMWYLCVLPWVQRPLLKKLVRNAEWWYLTFMLFMSFALLVYQSTDSYFMVRWMVRLQLSSDGFAYTSPSNIALLTWASLQLNHYLIQASWVAVNADAIISPVRYWKHFHFLIVLLCNFVVLVMFFVRDVDAQLAPQICLFSSCDASFVHLIQLFLMRTVFQLKYFVSLCRSSDALVILRAPVSLRSRPVRPALE